jgi:hypothetical protein
MMSKTRAYILWIESHCQSLVRQVALLVFSLLMGASPLAHAQGPLCSSLFQFETKLPSFPFLLNRGFQQSRIPQESLDSLNEVASELSRRVETGELTKAKGQEARYLLTQIKHFNPKNPLASMQIFEIMARYSILISHGYTANVKQEATWFEDVLTRGQTTKRKSLHGNSEEILNLMQDKNFAEFRDRTMVGFRDIFKSTQNASEQPRIVFTFKDISISDFILNSDTGYYFIGLSRINGLHFDNNHDYTAMTFFLHDLLHIELSNMARKSADLGIDKDDVPNMTKRGQDLFALRMIYPQMDDHFSPFEKRFLRAGFFIALHEYGFTPYQFVRRVNANPEAAAKFIYVYLKQMEVLMRPLKDDMAILDKNPAKMKVLSKILTKFVSLTDSPL